MANFAIIATHKTLGVYSFTTGFIATPRPKPKSENEILFHALWLERQGFEEEAWNFLERHCPMK